jgi:hypothetical protein
MQECVFELRIKHCLLHWRLQRVVEQATQHRMDHRGEDQAANARLLRRLNHAYADRSLVGQKGWRDVEDRAHVLQRNIKARSIPQIAYRNLRG